jgi:hypothetical protein
VPHRNRAEQREQLHPTILHIKSPAETLRSDHPGIPKRHIIPREKNVKYFRERLAFSEHRSCICDRDEPGEVRSGAQKTAGRSSDISSSLYQRGTSSSERKGSTWNAQDPTLGVDKPGSCIHVPDASQNIAVDAWSQRGPRPDRAIHSFSKLLILERRNGSLTERADAVAKRGRRWLSRTVKIMTTIGQSKVGNSTDPSTDQATAWLS